MWQWALVVFGLTFGGGHMTYNPPMVIPGFASESRCREAVPLLQEKFYNAFVAVKTTYTVIYECVETK